MDEPAAIEDGEPQEEYRITKPGTITLRRWGTLDLGAQAKAGKKVKDIGRLLPTGSGVYVIHDASGPWYAGQATDFRQRFAQRFSALKDFKLDATVLDGRSITCYLVPDSLPAMAVFFSRSGTKRVHLSDNKTGILTAIEDHFISRLGTLGKGNEKTEKATIGSGVAAAISVATAPGAPAWESLLPGNFALPVR